MTVAAIELPTVSRITRCTFELVRAQSFAPTRGGLTYAYDVGEPRWRASYETARFIGRERGAFLAWLDIMTRGGTFFAYDPFAPSPAEWSGLSSGWGAPQLDGVVVANRQLVTSGWADDAQLRAGDLVSFDDGVSMRLHRLVSDVQANGVGGATLTVEPAPLTASSYPRTLRVYRAAAEMRIDPSSIRQSDEVTGWAVSFEATQMVRA